MTHFFLPSFRAPVVRFANIHEMNRAREWLDDHDNFSLVKDYFDSTSRFARLQKLKLGRLNFLI